MLQALIFDCDGVLAETERDGHRLAFNRAFAAKRLDLEWPVGRYGELLTTAGGKERLRRHFDETAWPAPVADPGPDRDAFIRDLHGLKTGLFMDLIGVGKIPPRPGVLRLVDEAIGAGIRLSVCSTADMGAVKAVVDSLLGPDRAPHFSIFAGDMAAARKPDPAVYLLARDGLGLDAALTVVIEDSAIGLQAALAAGMTCIVTPSFYTAAEDFTGAARVVADLDEGNIRLADCAALLGDGDVASESP